MKRRCNKGFSLVEIIVVVVILAIIIAASIAGISIYKWRTAVNTDKENLKTQEDVLRSIFVGKLFPSGGESYCWWFQPGTNSKTGVENCFTQSKIQRYPYYEGGGKDYSWSSHYADQINKFIKVNNLTVTKWEG